MKFEVDEKLVEPIIRDRIAAAVVSQLGNTDELVTKMVTMALAEKVNDKGEVDSYQSANKYDLVEALAGKAIREAATDAIREIVEKQRPKIQKAIEDQLLRAPKKTAAAIVSAFCESAGHKYKIQANFVIDHDGGIR